MKLSETLRAGHVHRWNIVATIRPQSIAEHMWNVTMIATDISKWMGVKDPAPAGFVGLCLRHDRHEVITGDVPTPTKRKFDEHHDWYQVTEFGEDPEYDALRSHYLDTHYEHILKIADILDGIWFLTVWGVKSRHVTEILQELDYRYQKALTKGQKRWSAYNWKQIDRIREEMF